MARSQRSGALTALCVLTLILAAAPHAAATSSRGATRDTGSIGIRLVDAPTASRDDPRARIYIVDHLKPGTVIKRRIEVSNTTHSSEALALYAAAASITKGSFLGAAAHTPNDLSTWTSVSPPKPVVPAGGKVTAMVTIAVPKDAAPGEQYGVVWAEARSAANVGGVVQVSRVGIRLYVSVGPGGPPAADFTIDSLTAERSAEGLPMVVAAVRNTGGRALDMNGTLTLSDGPAGLSAGPFPASLGVTLGLDDTEPVSIALGKQLPAGPWLAQITLHSGLVERTATATITFPAAGTGADVQTKSGQPVWLYLTGAGIALVLALIALYAILRRRPLDRLPTPRTPSSGREVTSPHQPRRSGSAQR